VVARATPLTRLLLLVAQQHYLIRRTVAALIHAVRGCICFQFVQFELMIIRQTANTKQPPQNLGCGLEGKCLAVAGRSRRCWMEKREFELRWRPRPAMLANCPCNGLER